MTAFFRVPPRNPSWARPVMVAARSVHIAAMAVIVGGVAFGAGFVPLRAPIALTIASGAVLLGVELYRSGTYLYQGAGLAMWLKLALLALGNLFVDSRFRWYLAATIVASIGAHMTRGWRHWPVPEPGGPRRSLQDETR